MSFYTGELIPGQRPVSLTSVQRSVVCIGRPFATFPFPLLYVLELLPPLSSLLSGAQGGRVGKTAWPLLDGVSDRRGFDPRDSQICYGSSL